MNMVDISNKYDSKFATRLRNLMKEHKVTQQALAKAIGGTRQAISQYADGSILPNIEKFEKMADYFNVSCDYLIGKTDVKTNDISIKEMSKLTGLGEQSIKTLIDHKERQAFDRILSSKRISSIYRNFDDFFLALDKFIKINNFKFECKCEFEKALILYDITRHANLDYGFARQRIKDSFQHATSMIERTYVGEFINDLPETISLPHITILGKVADIVYDDKGTLKTSQRNFERIMNKYKLLKLMYDDTCYTKNIVPLDDVDFILRIDIDFQDISNLEVTPQLIEKVISKLHINKG